MNQPQARQGNPRDTPRIAFWLRSLPGLGNVLLGIMHLSLVSVIPNFPIFQGVPSRIRAFVGFLYAAVAVAMILAGLGGIFGRWVSRREKVFSMSVVFAGGAYGFAFGLVGLMHHMASAFSVLSFSFGLLQMISVLALWFQPIRPREKGE